MTAELEQQLAEIDREASGLATQIEELERKLGGVESNATVLANAESLLLRLRDRLDQPLTYDGSASSWSCWCVEFRSKRFGPRKSARTS
jgi:hypothetical protein